MSNGNGVVVAAPARSKGLHIALWVFQVLLGGMFIMAGLGKSLTPVAELATQMPWVNHFSPAMVRFIGVSELLGGLGLILPAALRIKPILTPVAALGLLTIMILAAVHHIQQGEPFVMNVVLGAVAAFIAWGRLKKAPIAPRG